jgi:hypothetical protein
MRRRTTGVAIAVLLTAGACGNGNVTLGAPSTISARTGTPAVARSATAGPIAAATPGTATPAGAAATAATAHATPVRPGDVTASPSSTLRPTPNPAALREENSGQTVHVRVGQTTDVRLPGGPNGGYHTPTSTSDVMRRTDASGGYPTGQPAQARFIATRPGTADLTSTTDFTCLHTTPACLPPQREWTVHVVVA